MKIIGLKKININVIKNKKGDILKFISKKNTFFRKFGEVYFSEINEKKNKRVEFTQTKLLLFDCLLWKGNFYFY